MTKSPKYLTNCFETDYAVKSIGPKFHTNKPLKWKKNPTIREIRESGPTIEVLIFKKNKEEG